MLRDTAEEALRSANLWDEVKDRLDRPGAGLSGGQQQRLCIARAIAVKPDVLLMDEPCSALDPISTLAIEDLIMNLKREYTVVIVTHNMQQASRVSDTTAFFTLSAVGEPGHLIEMGPTEKIFSTPTEKATEDYINQCATKESISAGSSLKFCLVATGEADFYPRLGRTMEWDTAAGHAVVLGAGGQVLRFDDHTPLTYGKPIYENPFFIVTAPGVELKDA